LTDLQLESILFKFPSDSIGLQTNCISYSLSISYTCHPSQQSLDWRVIFPIVFIYSIVSHSLNAGETNNIYSNRNLS
jgi:hypothetical protein